uniref:Amino acid/amide ABC transporter membrane protein 1, HAAT family n=1 Tax=Candidatus Kentrum sp. FW TaxID=2126338 RepID=A0A450SZ89_9GAMM|nr:MAG: amino acid/amide ABC transporter membrane protein 1, HAAT family [Candidatus Kentron sp. FW]
MIKHWQPYARRILDAIGKIRRVQEKGALTLSTVTAVCLALIAILNSTPVLARHHGALLNAALDLPASVQTSLAPSVSHEVAPDPNVQPPDFETLLNGLKARKFSGKEQAVKALARFGDPRTVTVLQTMLEGRLYYRKSDGRVVGVRLVGGGSGKGIVATDMVSGQVFQVANKRKLKKIRVNNKLRRVLRALMAELMLSDPDPKIRLQSVEQMIKAVSSESARQVRALLTSETDPNVIAAANTLIALHDMGSGEREARLTAISVLAESDRPEARVRLVSLLERGRQGQYTEPDILVREKAEGAIEAIDERLATYEFIETLFFGLSLGSVLLLIAIGLAITFGVMGVINMAHGELMMIGAYTTYITQQLMPNAMEWSLAVAIPAAFIVAGVVGIVIERTVVRFLYGRPLETLLATFGISLILQQLVRTTISAQNVAVSNPAWMSGSLQINPALAITYNRIYILIFAFMVFVVLLLILKKTWLGLSIRAVSQNRAMANAMGIRSEWVDALTFGLGAGVAGIAGVALSQLTNVGPNMGQAYIIDSFMVVVFSGVGNLWGTFVGAMSLGVVSKFLEPWAGAVLAKIMVLVFIILFIQKRPRGLFPQKGRAADH